MFTGQRSRGRWDGAHEGRAGVDRRDLFIGIALLALGVAVFGKSVTVGGPRGDSAARMMDGVLIHDWVLAGPSVWLEPLDFAVRQYSYYPSLGIGSTYPPGFAIVEAAFFAVFGISAITARLCIVAFGLTTLCGVYLLMRGFVGRLPSACAVLSLLAMPSLIFWTRQTALEMPTLAVLVWSALAGLHYARRATWPRLILWTVLSVSAVMFKQTAIFIFVPNAVLILVWAIRGHAPWRHVLVAALTSAAALGGYVALIWGGGPRLHELELILNHRSPWALLSAESWLTYARWAPRQVGLWIIAVSVVGILVALRRRTRLTALTLLWFVAFYVMSSVIQVKEPRYFFFGLLPIACWAGLGVGWLLAGVPRPALRGVAVTMVALVMVVTGIRRPIQYRPDYGSLVIEHQDRLEGRFVLFSGLRDADFIFAVRQHLGPRKCVVARTSKILYACATKPEYRFESFVEAADDVSTVLDDFAFDSIIVERDPPMNIPEERLMREALGRSESYTLAWSAVLRSGPDLAPTSANRVPVDIYVPRTPFRRRVRAYDLPIPLDNRNIPVSLEQLLADIRPST